MHRRIAAIACLLLVPVIGIAAHPHLWIDGTIDFELDADGVAGISVRWVFDDFNSADMLFSFDLDHDGELDRAEITNLYDNAFVHLNERGYFLIAESRSGRVTIPDATHFTASVEDERLVYEFRVPLEQSWQETAGLTVALFDEKYFIDFLTEPVSASYVRGARSIRATKSALQLETVGYGAIDVSAVAMEVE